MIYVEGYPIDVTKFNGGEIQVDLAQLDLSDITKPLLVEARLKTSDDILALIQVKTILDKFVKTPIELYLPRIPYAQSDRAMVETQCSGLKIFAQLLNSSNFSKVYVDDPHSDVSEALINNISIKHQSICLKETLEGHNVDYDFLISPDGGALKKIHSSASYLQLPIIQASKHRDVITGALTEPTVNTQHYDLTDKKVLIVDDISEYSTTTREVARILKEIHGVKQVDSFVTHGLYPVNMRKNPPSRFSFPLEYIDNLYVYHLWENKEEKIPPNVHYVRLF